MKKILLFQVLKCKSQNSKSLNKNIDIIYLYLKIYNKKYFTFKGCLKFELTKVKFELTNIKYDINDLPFLNKQELKYFGNNNDIFEMDIKYNSTSITILNLKNKPLRLEKTMYYYESILYNQKYSHIFDSIFCCDDNNYIIYNIFNNKFEKCDIFDNMNIKRKDFKIVMLPNNNFLTFGGERYYKNSNLNNDPNSKFSKFSNEIEFYNHETRSWKILNSKLQLRRFNFNVVLLSDNDNILISGGHSKNGYLRNCELYNISTDTIKNVKSMNNAVERQFSVLLPNGHVFDVGGCKSCEIYNPFKNEWRNIANMTFLDSIDIISWIDDETLIFFGLYNYHTSVAFFNYKYEKWNNVYF